MNELKVVSMNSQFVADSRDVSRMVGKRHADLLRDIDSYVAILNQNANLRSDRFFIPSRYNAGTGKKYRMYFLTRKGCDMVANKMTGESGVLFTASYVTKFEEMEQQQGTAPSTGEMLLEMAKRFIAQEKQLRQMQTQIETTNHRIDSLDAVNVIGDLQQRLTAMVKRYAHTNGHSFSKGWRDFTAAYNTAYHTNLTALVENYKEKHGLRELTRPQYLSMTGQLDDAIRVADKLLNSELVAG